MMKVQKLQRPTRARVKRRPTDAELAQRLRGTRGRCFAKQSGQWRDVVTGAAGTLSELEEAWLADLELEADAERASPSAAAFWQAQ